MIVINSLDLKIYFNFKFNYFFIDPDYLKICTTFNANFRRLVRTIFSDSSMAFNYIYIDYKDGPTGSVSNLVINMCILFILLFKC